jgi:hypothetical protein
MAIMEPFGRDKRTHKQSSSQTWHHSLPLPREGPGRTCRSSRS